MRTEKLAYSDETVPLTDGRMPVEQLLSRIDNLTTLHGNMWRKKVVATQIDYSFDPSQPRYLQIANYITKLKGPALWLLAGIHGEESAAPIAVANKIDVIHALAQAGVPIVLFGLCNPLGYHNNTRHPNPDIEASVTEADHLMVHLTDPTRARVSQPATYESAMINARVLELLPAYPPLLVLNLHEDESDDNDTDSSPEKRYATYLYVISKLADQHADPVAKMIADIWRDHNIPVWDNGYTPDGDYIQNGMMTIRPGEGSIDEFLTSEYCVINGVVRPKHSAKIAITTETRTRRKTVSNNATISEEIPLSERVAVQSLVLDKLPQLWQAAMATYL